MTMHSKQVKNNLKTDSFYNFGHQTACGLAKKTWFSIFFLSKKHVFNHTFCIIIVYLCNKSLDVEKCMTMRSKHVHKHLKTHSFSTFGHKKACGLAKKTWFSIFFLSKKHVFNHTFCIIIVYLCNKSLDVEKCMTMRSKHVHKHLKTHSFSTFGHKKAYGLAKKHWFPIFFLPKMMFLITLFASSLYIFGNIIRRPKNAWHCVKNKWKTSKNTFLIYIWAKKACEIAIKHQFSHEAPAGPAQRRFL